MNGYNLKWQLNLFSCSESSVSVSVVQIRELKLASITARNLIYWFLYYSLQMFE